MESSKKDNDQDWYDEVYFDSDEDSENEEGSAGIGLMGKKKNKSIPNTKKKVISNDELMYDPDLDDKDEQWVSKQIDNDSSRNTADVPLDEKTDAILTCPMCFTTLCFSCQRHEKYANQFRAMFVRNCHTVPGEKYKIPGDNDESYFKVVCDTCGIHVAMLDDDEVYHFFNVVATGR